MSWSEFPVPRSEADLSAGWFSALLHPRVVESVTLERLEGLSNAPFRARLGYAGDDADDRGSREAPPSVIVKMGRAPGAIRGVTRGATRGATANVIDREFLFYQDLAPHLPVPVPRVLYRLASSDGHFILVLEDLLLRKEIQPFKPGDLPFVVETLGRRLHPPHWDSPLSAKHPYLRTMASFVERVESRLGEGVPRLLQRFRGEIGDDERELISRLPGRFADAVRPLVDVPATLCHHDLNRRNLFVEGPGANREVIFVDWQLVSAVPGVRDLSFLIQNEGGGLGEASERALLERYHAGLMAEGVLGYTFGRLVEDYRRSIICDFGRIAMTASNHGLPSGTWEQLGEQLANRAGAVERWCLLELL